MISVISFKACLFSFGVVIFVVKFVAEFIVISWRVFFFKKLCGKIFILSSLERFKDKEN